MKHGAKLYTVKKHQKKSCKIPQTSKTPTAMIKELAAVFLTVYSHSTQCPIFKFVYSATRDALFITLIDLAPLSFLEIIALLNFF